MSSREEMLELLKGGRFPVFESIARSALSLLNKDHVGNRELAGLMHLDPGLIQMVMKRSNAAAYGVFSGNVENVPKALYLLGHDEVVSGLATYRLLEDLSRLQAKPHLRKALGIALLTSLLSTTLVSSRLGLISVFRFIAEVMIADRIPEVYCRYLQACANSADLDGVARSFFGTELPSLSVDVLQAWNIPLSIRQEIKGNVWLQKFEGYSRRIWASGLTTDLRQDLVADFSDEQVAKTWDVLSRYIASNALLSSLQEAVPSVSSKPDVVLEGELSLSKGLSDVVDMLTDESKHATARDRMFSVLATTFGLDHVFFVLRDGGVEDSLPLFKLTTGKASDALFRLGRGAGCLFSRALVQKRTQVLVDGRRHVELNPSWHVDRFPHVRGIMVFPMPRGKGFVYGGSKRVLKDPDEQALKLAQAMVNQISLTF